MTKKVSVLIITILIIVGLMIVIVHHGKIEWVVVIVDILIII